MKHFATYLMDGAIPGPILTARNLTEKQLLDRSRKQVSDHLSDMSERECELLMEFVED